MRNGSLIALALVFLCACGGSSDPEPSTTNADAVTTGDDTAGARADDCLYVGPDEACLASSEAACSAYGCEPGQCTCSDAQSRNTCSCGAPSASCTYLGPSDECIESYAAACAAYGCAEGACLCTEARSRNTCVCRP